MPQAAPFDALYSQGIAAAQAGRLGEALRLLDAALAQQPAHVPARVNRGNVLRLLGRAEDALADFEQAIALRGHDAAAHFYRAFTLGELGRVEEALAGYDRVVALKPDFAPAHNNRANALKALERFEEALAAYDRALALQPDDAEAHFNRGAALQAVARFDEALAAFDRAIALDPRHADARWNKSLLLLFLGRYEEGWALYEWRWKRKPARDFEAPQWTGGEPLAGRTILLHAEQGFGDTLQFCRYAPMVAERGARVVLEVPAELLEVMRSLEGVEQLVAKGDAMPRFELHCPLLSLPHAFGTTLASVPAQVPYLHGDPARVARWRERLGPATRPRVGIAWSGRAAQTDDFKRSMALADLRPLMSPDWELVSLQKDVREGDRAALEASGIRHFGGELRDFADTAALCELTDLVVSVDSSVAHLAGALARPLWVMLSWMPDWRWLRTGEANPWYPTARLYRQATKRDWAGVAARIAADLPSALPRRP